MRDSRFEEILMEVYREAYKAATPSANFDDLIANAELNEFGQKIIKFMDYTIPEKVSDEIVMKVCKKYRLNKENTRKIQINYALGCSPKYAKEDGEAIE